MRQMTVITIHPEFIDTYGSFGVVKAARNRGLAHVRSLNLRDFAVDRHGSIDDAPYGGGDSMVMRPEPLTNAIESLPDQPLVILTSPCGRPWTHKEAVRLASSPRPLAFICGRFAGVDQRFVDQKVDEEFSCGDFVVSGGELPALMMIDSILRLIPGVLGDARSASNDSFADGFSGGLEHPLYTRPAEYRGERVPDVLLSGDHKAIEAWRQEAAHRRTEALRPDLLTGTAKFGQGPKVS